MGSQVQEPLRWVWPNARGEESHLLQEAAKHWEKADQGRAQTLQPQLRVPHGLRRSKDTRQETVHCQL